MASQSQPSGTPEGVVTEAQPSTLIFEPLLRAAFRAIAKAEGR